MPARLSLIVCALAAAVGCGAESQGAGPDRLSVTLHGHALDVHLAAGSTHRTGPLLIYATGDGGWPGDEALFGRMRPWGCPMAGFSSADYVSQIDGPGRVVEPGQVAADFGTIIDAAVGGLKLSPGTSVVLVGFSRGAGLAVAAAIDARLRGRLGGILAVALTGEEEYVAERAPGARPDDTPVMLQTYAALPRLGPLRLAVVQSTRDEFLPAAEAQRRFGPDSPARRFRAIDAADHSFGGKLAELGDEMKAGFNWIVGG